MGRQDEIIKERIKKIEELRKNGVNPYPYSYDQKDKAAELQLEHAKLKSEKKSKKTAKIAGRMMSLRDLGKIAFGVLQDGSGKIQVLLQDGETSDKVFEFFKKYIDSGDFIGVEGPVLRTKRGELSVLVKRVELLSKSILPLPDKWHGLEDKEERYRKRYLDLLMNPQVKEVFLKRERIIDAIREFLKARKFNEVDTPYLQTVYGGAAARPFTTHLNALDIPLFLAISPELYLKRLIVGGFDRVFTIARNFRNEGIDKWHNPEFSMMEIYQAYADYNDMMELTEQLFEHVARKVNGTSKVTIGGQEIDFKAPWKRMTMLDAIKKFAKIDADSMSANELGEFMREHRVESKGDSWGWRVQAIFEHFCEKQLIQPTFIIDHPVETTPLCKLHRNGDTRLIERFEPFALGAELANAYSELNDPVMQRRMLEEQQKELSGGNEEANPYDEDFVNAIEIGLPPTGGLGIGIDRMIILMLGQESIRDVLLFPFMRPEKVDRREPAETKEMKVKDAKVMAALKESLPINRDQAITLLKKHNKEQGDMNHYLESGAVMKGLALHLGKNADYWEMLGLMHDIDWGMTKHDVKTHLTKAPALLEQAGFDEDFIQIILSHGYGHECAGLQHEKRTKQIEHALASAETVTGLIHSYALMRKTIKGMDVSGLKKKFKDKKFAAGVDREIIMECEKLGLTIDEFFEIAIRAITGIAKEVHLPHE